MWYFFIMSLQREESQEEKIEDIASNINNNEFSDNSNIGKRFFQIDIMKTICIIIVISMHTFHRFFPIEFLWVIIRPVSLFFIILGFNYGNSFKRKNLHKLSELYSFQYFKKMFLRLVFPLLLINLICFIIDLIIVLITGFHVNNWSITQLDYVSWGKTNLISNPMNLFYFLIGTPYFPGPGEYYIVILMQFILIFPLIYKIFDKNPILGFIFCYLIDLCFQLIAGQIPVMRDFFDNNTFLFTANIFRYFSLIGFGLYFVNNTELFSKNNLFIWPMFIFSLYSLSGYGLFYGIPLLPNEMYSNFLFEFVPYYKVFLIKYFYTNPLWGGANLFNYPYDAFVFLLFMKIFPSQLNKDKLRNQSISRFFKKYSRLTYHILLVQIVYFFVTIPIDYGISIGINNSLYDAFIAPIIAANGGDINLITINVATIIILMRAFTVFLNCAVSFSLARIFYNIDISLQKYLKKITLFKRRDKENLSKR